MIVIGDVHLRDNEIKKLQAEAFFTWIKEQEFLKKEQIIVFLGDLFEVAYPSVDLVVYYLQLFKDWKDKTIYILEGNHDCNLETNALDFFKTLDNVIVIKDAQEIEIEGKKCFCLPHYDHEGTDKEPMIVAYSKLEGTYDYIFAHVLDETQNFGNSKNFCDLTKLKGKKLFGHVHSPTVQKDGTYLGSVTKNSSTEKDDQKLLAVIDESGLNFVNVPSFMEYETVKYGEDPTHKDTLVYLNVLEAPSKFEAKNYYETKFPNVKINKVITKRQEVLNTEVPVTETDEVGFEAFAIEKGLSPEVIDICKKVL